MSDEKNSGNTFNINAVPSCIDEPVKAVLNPGANQIGTLFGDLLAMATSKIHFSAEKMRLQQAHDLEEFKKSLSDKLNAKPAECLVEPRMQVVGPAVENAKFCMDEPQIRKMFQNLLANSADIRYQSQVHPSFSAMIAQMSPLDAENLELFKGGRTLPIARYKYTLENDGERAAFTNCFLKNPKMIHATDIDLQATSLSSLERQGLIEIRYDCWLLDEKLYDVFIKNELRDILESEGNQQIYEDKFNRVDVKARDSEGEIIIVEVQVTRELYFLERILYGAAKAITEHIKLGELYSEVKKVYSISILYFDIGKGDDYLYHGQNTFTGVHTGDHLHVTVKERDALVQRLPSEIFPEYFLIRVNEFDQVATTPLEEWLDYLKNDYIRPDTKTPGLKEAREKLVYYNMDEAERAGEYVP